MLDKKKIIKIDIYTSGRLLVSSYLFNISEEIVFGRHCDLVVVKGSNIRQVDKGTPAEAVLYCINGDRVKYDTRIDVCTEFQVNVTLGENYSLLEERRRFYKLETDLSAKISLLTRDDEEITFEQPVFAKFKNINIGGVFLCCSSYEFQQSDTIMLSFQVLGKDMDIPAKILRVQKRDDKIDGYGCSFLKPKTWQEEVLARYIHKIQCDQMDTIKNKINSR